MRGLLKGHALISEGAPHDDTGNRFWPYGQTGVGRGKCSCGTLSPVLPSTAQRKVWHRDHKGDVIGATVKDI